LGIKAVLFDGYGTLYQCPSLGTEVHKLIRAIARENRKKGVKLNALRTGLSHDYNFLEIMYDANPLIKAEIMQYINNMPELIRQTTCYPNSVKVLEQLKENGYSTGLISDVSNRSKPDLSSLGLEHLLDIKVWSFQRHTVKPDPDLFIYAAKQLHVKASECLMVGDGRHRDMQGAKNAGMYHCLLDRSGAKKFEGYKIKSLLEVPQIIARIDEINLCSTVQ
jgi:HAD superfamily hydrolase (TIGR01549 family)